MRKTKEIRRKANKNKTLSGILILILIGALTMTMSTVSAEANNQGNTVVVNATPVPTTMAEGKFRVGPTVKIRPLNDIINKSADGIIELYFDNPSLNDVLLTVDVHIIVPSGIHIYGQGFGIAQATGILYTRFEIPPGAVRTAYINIKSEKTGNFYAQFNGLYYPGDNKDNYQPISLTYPFKVYEPSPDPESHKLTNPMQIGGSSPSWIDDKIVPAILIAVLAGLIGLVYRIIEIKYQHKLQTDSKTTKSRTIEGTVTESETTESTTKENR